MGFTLILALFAASAASQQRYAPPERPEWNLPVEPFRVVGNIYYVGAANVSAILITTDAGHILIETGFRETVPLIEANVRKLGFRFEDIRLLLSSHAHYDHSGGLADVKAATGARFLSSPAEEAAFARGGTGDFAFGNRYPFPPVQPDGLLRDGEVVRLGDFSLTTHFTPGHTKGCVSFSTQVREGPRSYHVLFPCSLTAPGYELVGNVAYPDIVQDFESSIAKLRSLPCDIFNPHHRSATRMLEISRTRTDPEQENPFLDRAGCSAYLDSAHAALRDQIQVQLKRDRTGP